MFLVQFTEAVSPDVTTPPTQMLDTANTCHQSEECTTDDGQVSYYSEPPPCLIRPLSVKATGYVPIAITPMYFHETKKVWSIGDQSAHFIV